jgi:hypothetical protein
MFHGLPFGECLDPAQCECVESAVLFEHMADGEGEGEPLKLASNG